MVKTYAIFCLILFIMAYTCYNLVQTVQSLKEDNKQLTQTLEANLQAAKDKEERTGNELKQLTQQITDLRSIHTVCLDSSVDASVIEWLQQLQEQYPDTISITFTE